jgi:hypothetical protein
MDEDQRRSGIELSEVLNRNRRDRLRQTDGLRNLAWSPIAESAIQMRMGRHTMSKAKAFAHAEGCVSG